MRTIGVVTVGRSDYGIYLPVLRCLSEAVDVNLVLIVGGMHLRPEFGMTVERIVEDGFTISDRVDFEINDDTPVGIAIGIGRGVSGFAEAIKHRDLDLLLVLGDRYEMHAAAVAALPFGLPVAHIHGGELSEGAIDDALRHSMTKLSHLHFVSTEAHRDRVVQLGEEPWRVTVSGAPGLDHLQTLTLTAPEKLEDLLGLALDTPPLLVTYHPVTMDHQNSEWQINELLAALEPMAFPIVFSLPNADMSGQVIVEHIRRFVAHHTHAVLFDNLGTQVYFSLMAIASAMVGNSSSGIIEAASFALPVVNVGIRQKGRHHGENVVDVGNNRQEIREGLAEVLSPAFSDGLEGMVNLYGDGFSARRIVERLRTVPVDQRLLQKRFHDIDVAASSQLSGVS